MDSNDRLQASATKLDEICALLGHYAASIGNSLPTFRENISVLNSTVDNTGIWILDA